MTLETRLPVSPVTSSLAALLLRTGSIAGTLTVVETQVRREPGAFHARWQLFQWLCVVGDWQRALKQLQVATQLAPDFAQTAHVYRDLIRTEAFRQAVFTGERQPGELLPTPGWVGRLHVALAQTTVGDVDAADRSRHLALSEVPVSSDAHDGATFSWITDSDTRLGPTCEIVSAGRYAWLPFAQLRKLEMSQPADLLDLIWRPATATLIDGMTARGFMPVRYPGSEQSSDACRLARETTWTEIGETGVIGLGQKTWMTDAGDVGLLDVLSLTLEACHG
ncbi:type VI secretion system accessory protein TagJ [Pandoraea sp. NPDC090278]|uniref:type VI secretion system accessory protein TagJ n=1 Tax=Pandoraea sp. NPDC090278 TaxID=3364391 RepID=UPI003839EC19